MIQYKISDSHVIIPPSEYAKISGKQLGRNIRNDKIVKVYSISSTKGKMFDTYA